MSKIKKILPYLFLPFGTILFCILLTELIFQLIDYPKKNISLYKHSKITGIQYAPNLDRIMIRPLEFKVTFKTNSLGLRDDEVEKEKDGCRILFLGDSMVSGHGVERPRIFADLLEKELGVEIINSGTAGFELIHYLKFFRHYGNIFKPDLTVLFLYLGNDLLNNKWIGDEENKKSKNDWNFQSETTGKYNYIKLYLLIKRSLGNRKDVIRARNVEWEPGNFVSLYLNNQDESSKREFELSKIILSEINEEVLKTRSKFLVVFIPIRTFVNPKALERYKSKFWNFDKIFDLDRPLRELTSHLKKEKIQNIDLTETMKEFYLNSEESLFYFFDGHLNQRGHRFIYDQLKDALKIKNNCI